MPILAVPYTPPAPPAVISWDGLSGMTWTGFNGDSWDLKGSMLAPAGVVLQRGVRGFTMPPTDRFTTKSPGTAGSRWRGSRTDEREVFWLLKVYQDAGSQAWMEFDRRFWATMHPERTGVWAVTHPDGTVRTLTLRFVNDGGDAFAIDPMSVGWAVYGVTLVAEQPYWEGAPVTQSWKTSPPVGFFGGVVGGSGPPFHISSGSSFATASIDNPGDVDAFPTWTLTGPLTSVSVGVDGHVVTYSVAIPSGQTRTIDTRPDRLTVVDQAGVDRIDDLGQAEFVPVPPGIPVPLTISVVGAGTVTMTLTPLYWRAW